VSIFGNYAYYYDLLYSEKKYEEEVGYVNKLIQHYFADAESLLELGCGTGVHAEYLAKLGYAVHGMDQSDAMLKIAYERWKSLDNDVGKRLSSTQGDIRNLHLGCRFDAVVALFHVVSYLPLNIDLEAAFQSAADHLDKGGLFLFDFWYGPGVLSDPPKSRVKEFENASLQIIREAEPVMQPNENLVDVYYRINIQDKESKQSETIEEQHRLRYLFRPELEDLLNRTGFKLVTCEEWLTGNEPGFDTWNACIVAMRT
jgi:SAM-dependent methyltransferase